MSPKPKLLLIGQTVADDVLSKLGERYEIVREVDTSRILEHLKQEEGLAGVFVGADQLRHAVDLGAQAQSARLLEGMADGIALVDSANNVLWANGRLLEWCGQHEAIGQNFYSLLRNPEILGPDFCPFHTALSTSEATTSTLRTEDNRYFQLHAAPTNDPNAMAALRHLIVTVRDVTPEMLQQQKLAAIHQAGKELADLKPEELLTMEVEERIELLKSNILHFATDLLHFDFIEIRLLDSESGQLTPLLALGMSPEAERRPLYAQPQNNGVTGFVAATGKSYLCEDTTEDPLYFVGAVDSKSSLTVPLILHDQVIGTFNVESPRPRAFTDSDLQFLEIFGREVAAALNTLELLVSERAGAHSEMVEAIHRAVALPVDDILNDAVSVMETYIGHQREVSERLQRILRNARDIKQLITKVGQKMSPAQASPHAKPEQERPTLALKQVLVVDADEQVRSAAHALLERYGCVVETAHDGAEACFMVRNACRHDPYDCIIADIRLPDMTGYELLTKLQPMIDHPPMALMTGFGYDPGHSIVKARQAGLEQVLYKPFRLDQLLSCVEKVVQKKQELAAGSA